MIFPKELADKLREMFCYNSCAMIIIASILAISLTGFFLLVRLSLPENKKIEKTETACKEDLKFLKDYVY